MASSGKPTLNDRLSYVIARWLSHPSGITQAIITTAIWFSVPWYFNWPFQTAIFWYLAYCTFISYATQFTLAYQNKKAELHMLNTMRLLVALAEEVKLEQVEQGGLLDEITHRIKEENSSSLSIPPEATTVVD